MSGPSFFQTLMGRSYYEGTLPRIARALERIATALEANPTTTPITATTAPTATTAKEPT